ncbi:MAG: hypothetical protein KC656_15685, partial [Myxococcales bacterium]|nr:hypothetical protein [Myxococcales bacterium]
MTRVPHPTPLGQILPVVGALAGLALAYVIPLVSVELIQGSSDAATVFAALLASGGALVLGMPWAAVLGARAGRALAGRL